MNNRYLIYTSKHPELDIRIFQKFAKSLSYDFSVVYINTRYKKCHILRNGRSRQIFVKNMFLVTCRLSLLGKVSKTHLNDPIDFLRFLPFALLLQRKFIYDFHENLPMQILHKDYLGNFRFPVSYLSAVFINFLRHLPILTISATPIISALFGNSRDNVEVRNLSLFSPTKRTRASTHVSNGNQYDAERVFFYLGALSLDRGAKNIESLLKNFPDWQFRMYGPELPNECDFLFACDNFNYCGFHPAEYLQEIISRDWVGILALKPLPNYIDSLPTKLFDYQSLGVKFVSPKFPYFEKVFDGPNAYFLDFEELEAKKDELLKFLNTKVDENVEVTNWNSEYTKYKGWLHEH